MSEVKTFFRHCPSCGRRFEIRLVSKKSVSSEGFVDKENHLEVAGSSAAGRSARQGAVMEEGRSFTADVEEFQYEYKCKHCGHEWSEIRETDRRVGSKGYTGD